MRYERLLDHAPRLILLAIDVKDANISLKDAQNFTHEQREHAKVEHRVAVAVGRQSFTVTVPSLVQDLYLEAEDEYDRHDAAEDEEAGEGGKLLKVGQEQNG